MYIQIKTQQELDAALQKGKKEFEIAASGLFLFKGFKFLDIKVLAEFRFSAEILLENATATLWGNATATLLENATATLWGNATATLLENATATLLENATATLYGNATATLRGNATATLLENATATLRGNATATLRGNATATLRGNATATLLENATANLYGNATATLRGNATAKASGFCSLSLWGKSKAVLTKSCHAFIMSADAKAKGGTQTKAKLKTPEDWCEYYGVHTERGLARVYKAVNGNYASNHGPSFKWLPGTKPKSELWDDQECSHGLHFSPCPEMTKEFVSDPAHYLECWVRVKDMRVYFNGSYPNKCKAPEVVRPVVEVDVNGNRLEKKEAAWWRL